MPLQCSHDSVTMGNVPIARAKCGYEKEKEVKAEEARTRRLENDWVERFITHIYRPDNRFLSRDDVTISLLRHYSEMSAKEPQVLQCLAQRYLWIRECEPKTLTQKPQELLQEVLEAAKDISRIDFQAVVRSHTLHPESVGLVDIYLSSSKLDVSILAEHVEFFFEKTKLQDTCVLYHLNNILQFLESIFDTCMSESDSEPIFFHWLNQKQFTCCTPSVIVFWATKLFPERSSRPQTPLATVSLVRKVTFRFTSQRSSTV